MRQLIPALLRPKAQFRRFSNVSPTLTAVLVGTKSVGKSTLFNQLVGEKLAIVDEVRGACDITSSTSSADDNSALLDPWHDA